MDNDTHTLDVTSPDQILDRLLAGNARFVEDKLDGRLQDSARRDKLTENQSPYAIVLSCADSRVVPELAFDTGLGELFVIRVAGNVANTSSVASIEYAVANLNTCVIVVLGHERCGAVTAAVAGGDNGPNLNHLLALVQPAVDACGAGAALADVVKRNAVLTVGALAETSEILRKALAETDASGQPKLRIVPAYYELGSGRVELL